MWQFVPVSQQVFAGGAFFCWIYPEVCRQEAWCCSSFPQLSWTVEVWHVNSSSASILLPASSLNMFPSKQIQALLSTYILLKTTVQFRGQSKSSLNSNHFVTVTLCWQALSNHTHTKVPSSIGLLQSLLGLNRQAGGEHIRAAACGMCHLLNYIYVQSTLNNMLCK